MVWYKLKPWRFIWKIDFFQQAVKYMLVESEEFHKLCVIQVLLVLRHKLIYFKIFLIIDPIYDVMSDEHQQQANNL